MSLTFQDLQQRVLTYLDDANNDGNLLTVVKNAINDANAQRATEFPWSFMRASTTTTFTCTSAQTYSLASDLGKPIYFYNNTQQKVITVIPDRHLNGPDMYATDASSGLDHRVILRGPINSSTSVRTLQFLRPPVVGDVIKYDYYRHPTTMSSNSDYPDIPFPHCMVLVWDALINLKAYTLEPDAIAVWQDNQQRALTSLYATYGQDADVVGGEGENLLYNQY